MRVVLNGVNVDPKNVEGEGGINIVITVSDTETDTALKRASNELTFYGEGVGEPFQVLKLALINAQNGRLAEVPVEFWWDCDGQSERVFKGVFRGAEASWCTGDCFIKCTAIEKTEDTKAADCMKSTLIGDNRNGFKQQAHPRMVYCDELKPDWLHHVILSASTGVVGILVTLYPIVAIFSTLIDITNALIDAINTLGFSIDNIDFDGNSQTTFLDEYTLWKDRLVDNIIGCGRVHPSPLLRDYINNVCTICGLNFSSTILNNPSSDYYNTVLFSAPVKKGTREDTDLYIDDNEPYKTGETLLQELGIVFNARKRIIGQTLYFERKDELPGASVWVDPAQLRAQGRLIDDVCFKWSSGDLPAFATYSYSEDALDIVGNEARHFYSEQIEWNSPPNDVQRGEKKTLFPFSMNRNRGDNIGSDILGDYAQFPFWTADIAQYPSVMLLERGLSAQPKLLVWDGNLSFGRVKRYDITGYEKNGDENFNYPYHLTEFNVTPNTGYASNAAGHALYARFHAINNPRVQQIRGVDFQFRFEFTMQHLQTMNPFAPVPVDPTDTGTIIQGETSTITINLSEGTILVAGKA